MGEEQPRIMGMSTAKRFIMVSFPRVVRDACRLHELGPCGCAPRKQLRAGPWASAWRRAELLDVMSEKSCVNVVPILAPGMRTTVGTKSRGDPVPVAYWAAPPASSSTSGSRLALHRSIFLEARRFGRASGAAKFQISEGCWAFRPPSPIRAGLVIIRQERTRHASGFYRDQRSCGPRRTEDTVSKESCVIGALGLAGTLATRQADSAAASPGPETLA